MLQRELVLNLKLGASFSLFQESGEAVLLGSKQQNTSHSLRKFICSSTAEIGKWNKSVQSVCLQSVTRITFFPMQACYHSLSPRFSESSTNTSTLFWPS